MLQHGVNIVCVDFKQLGLINISKQLSVNNFVYCVNE